MWRFVGVRRVEDALNRSRTGVRRCETTLKKWNIFEKKKIYTNCEYDETQTMNHLLQCPLIGTSCEKKK